MEKKRRQPARQVLPHHALGKKQLASDYARWSKLLATIESIMTAPSATEVAS
jgi:hypothetical protein